MQGAPFVLFCAGEDSGDILGESLVRSVVSVGLHARGVGGPRMQFSGLKPIADYEDLPVSGFFDVFLQAHRLKGILEKLIALLECENCVALVCIDYPGFNMRLAPIATRLKKPVLYVAPPQVWAWKKMRAYRLRKACLAVLFDFERQVYESYGMKAALLEHPFLRACRKASAGRLNPANPAPASSFRTAHSRVLLLPGSRLSQALRNVAFFKAVASSLHERNPECTFVVAVSRTGIRDSLESAFKGGEGLPGWITLENVPLQVDARCKFFSRFQVALCIPGSATLELALSGVSPVVTDVLDPITYFVCRYFVKTKYFALPNLLLSRGAIPEVYFTRRESRMAWNVENVAHSLQAALDHPVQSLPAELISSFANAVTPDELMVEFFRKFFERDSH